MTHKQFIRTGLTVYGILFLLIVGATIGIEYAIINFLVGLFPKYMHEWYPLFKAICWLCIAWSTFKFFLIVLSFCWSCLDKVKMNREMEQWKQNRGNTNTSKSKWSEKLEEMKAEQAKRK